MSETSPSSNSPASGFKLPPWLTIVLVLAFLGFAWYQNQQAKKAEQRVREQAELAKNSNTVSQPEAKPVGRETESPAGKQPRTDSNDVAVRGKGTPSNSKLPDANEPLPAEVTQEKQPANSNSKPMPIGASPDKAVETTQRSPTQTRAGPTPSTPDRSNPEKQPPTTAKNSKPVTQPSNNPNKPDGGKNVGSPTVDKNDPTGDKWTIVENQTIKNYDRVVYRGTIDLKPTLDRIARGERNSHRNDGSTFGNRERRLPQKQSGYYTEYVHPTKGVDGPGPQRIILGKGGDIWYTPDHYETFKKIK